MERLTLKDCLDAMARLRFIFRLPLDRRVPTYQLEDAAERLAVLSQYVDQEIRSREGD